MFRECAACKSAEYCFEGSKCLRKAIPDDFEDQLREDDQLQEDGYFSELIENIKENEDEAGASRSG